MGSKNSRLNAPGASNTLREYLECSRENPPIQTCANNSATHFKVLQAKNKRRWYHKLKGKFPRIRKISAKKNSTSRFKTGINSAGFKEEDEPKTIGQEYLQVASFAESCSDELSDLAVTDLSSDNSTYSASMYSDWTFRENTLAEFNRLVEELELRDNITQMAKHLPGTQVLRIRTSTAIPEERRFKARKRQGDMPAELRLWVPETHCRLFTHKEDRRVASIARACNCFVELTGRQKRNGRRREEMVYEVAVAAGFPDRLTKFLNMLTDKFVWFKSCELTWID